jgi:hypothetical protein
MIPAQSFSNFNILCNSNALRNFDPWPEFIFISPFANSSVRIVIFTLVPPSNPIELKWWRVLQMS